ncbi:MAG: murein biosynthesis integral membrane protein MurJ [Mycobacterium sp.]|nr:murein biosynthesis integral membrane protein MurJ [Mycobacterium sp.]
MALATLVSRITGFIRIVLLAAILGAALSSAFSVANQLPNMIAALVLEATFTAIFVPVLARAERDDSDGGAAFVRRLVTLATTLLLAVTVLAVTCAPQLVRLMLGADPQVNAPLTTAFAFLLLPQVIFYGLSSVFMAILNTRNVFGPPAWAPVLNNVVAIAALGLYLIVPGELSVDPVQMGNAKLLVLGIGTTLGVAAQAAVLLVAIRSHRISLRPLWGIDDRLKRFGTMALAMVLYVLISQIGFVVGNQIASTAAASGPAIYNYTWMVLMLPFGMIGVTILTVVMPRLSRNAAAEDNTAVLADFSLATRLQLVTLIPVVAFMTVAGPAIGSALFAYGNFGQVDANYLGMAIALSSFTLIPYALVLLQLRVFYAREQPWTPILIIMAITATKIALSLLAPHLTDDPDLVAGYLGAANGLGFLVGAVLGHLLLGRSLRPPGGRLLNTGVLRNVVLTATVSVSAAIVAAGVDHLLGLSQLTDNFGGAGSMLRLVILAAVMLPLIAALLVAAGVPDAVAGWRAIQRRVLRRTPAQAALQHEQATSQPPHRTTLVTYPESGQKPADGGTPEGRGPKLSDQPSGVPSGQPSQPARPDAPTTQTPIPAPDAPTTKTPTSPGPTGTPTVSIPGASPAPTPGATTKIPRQSADSFHPDVAAATPSAGGTESYGGRHHSSDPDGELIPGATIVEGRYRLLVSHGGPPGLRFWQALDTALDRQVALTLIDPDGKLPAAELNEILSRTQQLSRIQSPGMARVLDVTKTGRGGIVVSEWIRGGSLKEVADTSPSPLGAARAVQSLATAASEAHSAGVAMSLDHPSRIRVSIDGDVALAFPATLPAATPEQDVRGIGAALYALLMDRWPLPETGVASGLRHAEFGPSGELVEPRVVNAEIPFQISAAAVRSVQIDGGIRSAPTLLNLLQQATAAVERTDLVEPVTSAAVPAPASNRKPSRDDPQVHAQRRRTLMIGIAAGSVVLIVAVVVLASFLGGLFGDGQSGLKGDRLGLNTGSSGASAPAGQVVKPTAATVFSPEGGADAPDLAGLAIDGNPATAWPTDTYNDAVPFPGFKNGVGLMLQLPAPTVVGSVTISVSSTGTQVQIRSATSASPNALEDTTAMTQPTALKPGSNTIDVPSANPTSFLLVWISTLGQTNGKSRTDVSEITVRAAK